MFRTGFLSTIRSLVLYTQQQVYVVQVLLTACWRDPTSKHLVGFIMRNFVWNFIFDLVCFLQTYCLKTTCLKEN